MPCSPGGECAYLIMGLEQLIDRAHQHGIRVFGVTLTPYEGADYHSDYGEATRQEVNRWIRPAASWTVFLISMQP